jgi:hypothetical protein
MFRGAAIEVVVHVTVREEFPLLDTAAIAGTFVIRSVGKRRNGDGWIRVCPIPDVNARQ